MRPFSERGRELRILLGRRRTPDRRGFQGRKVLACRGSGGTRSIEVLRSGRSVRLGAL
jgi:hypothetical protein